MDARCIKKNKIKHCSFCQESNRLLPYVSVHSDKIKYYRYSKIYKKVFQLTTPACLKLLPYDFSYGFHVIVDYESSTSGRETQYLSIVLKVCTLYIATSLKISIVDRLLREKNITL